MKATLICTVGGSHEPILRAISGVRPDHVCFVCSGDDPATGNKGSYVQIEGKGNVIKARFGDDKPTLPNIPAQAGLDEDQFEIIEVRADDFDDVYRKVTDWLGRQNDTRLIADYTGGTKTMSAALTVAALDDERVELQLVSGGRSNLVKVESGAECVMPASVEASRFARQLKRALFSWRRFAYEESIAMLEALHSPRDHELRGEYQRALDLSRGFAAWDRFDHAGAREILMRYRAKQGALWPQLYCSLDLLMSAERGEPLRLYDLWRNAQRRAAQGRYDDAVARLYRLLEWSAQWILRQADIDTADVPPEKIPDGIELTVNREGKHQAGLFNAWALAAEYGGETVRRFWQQQGERMRDHIQGRNHSILAHGFEPLDEGAWLRFASWVEEQLLPLLLQMSSDRPWNIHKLPPQLPDALPSKKSEPGH